MLIAKVKFAQWDKAHICDPANLKIAVGDQVIFKTDLGNEIGSIAGFEEIDIEKFSSDESNELKPILRRATMIDLEKLPSGEKKEKLLAECQQIVRRHDLPMKLVDMLLSYDGARLTFAFIADGRIDFRDLVKELTRNFNRTIRLQQIGIRDEARLEGDCGHCGRQLCCRTHIGEFVSITSEMAEAQQCEHRGSDRISGCCGRLMCCLAYEEGGYLEMAKNFPPIGASVNVDGKRGEIIGWHLLKRTVDVKFSDEEGKGFTIAEVDLDRNKK